VEKVEIAGAASRRLSVEIDGGLERLPKPPDAPPASAAAWTFVDRLSGEISSDRDDDVRKRERRDRVVAPAR